MENIELKQNSRISLIYLKANYYCERKSRKFSSLSMLISFLICILGILNKYFYQFIEILFNDTLNLAIISNNFSEGINLLAGLVIIVNLFFSLQIRKFKIESVNILEYYDSYLFEIPLNRMIMEPLSEAMIYNYASKVHKKDIFFIKSCSNLDVKERGNKCFNYQNKILEHEYRLLLFVKSFFMSIWISFVILIFGLAVSFNEKFLSTLINILFPSLSILVLIVESHYNFNLRMKTLQNNIKVMEEYKKLDDRRINNNLLRNIQDGIFNLRMADFNIPTFLVNKYQRKTLKQKNNDSKKKNQKRKTPTKKNKKK